MAFNGCYNVQVLDYMATMGSRKREWTGPNAIRIAPMQL